MHIDSARRTLPGPAVAGPRSGNFYAPPLTEALGLEPDGLVRVASLHYNIPEEVDRLLAALEQLE